MSAMTSIAVPIIVPIIVETEMIEDMILGMTAQEMTNYVKDMRKDEIEKVKVEIATHKKLVDDYEKFQKYYSVLDDQYKIDVYDKQVREFQVQLKKIKKSNKNKHPRDRIHLKLPKFNHLKEETVQGWQNEFKHINYAQKIIKIYREITDTLLENRVFTKVTRRIVSDEMERVIEMLDILDFETNIESRTFTETIHYDACGSGYGGDREHDETTEITEFTVTVRR